MVGNTRDPRTGRFAVSTGNAPEAAEGRFPTRTELDVENTSATDTMPGNVHIPRYAPAGDDLAQGGRQWPVQVRRAVLVPPDDDAATVYGNRQGLLTRAAARRLAGPMDPTSYLTGADDGHTSVRSLAAGRAAARGGGPSDPGGTLVTGLTPRAAYVAPRGQERAGDGIPR